MIETRFYHSLIPVKPDCEPQGSILNEALMCKNQPYSFQIAYKITDASKTNVFFYVRFETELELSNYYINCVPVLHTDYANMEKIEPVGLYPDILLPKKTNPQIVKKHSYAGMRSYEKDEKVMLKAYNDSWQALWITVNEKAKTVKSGVYDVKIKLYSNDTDELLGESQIKIEVIDEKLPIQSLMYANWFHHDCLCDYYNVEVFTDKYFEIMSDYVEKAARNGMNMILLPSFTPALDTPVGEERMTVQLTKVKLRDGKYVFDFSLMKRYIAICRRCGIKYFEHAHFFTQWGAKAAPKIIVDVDGKDKMLFGWHTKATSKKYVAFLREYITAFKQLMKEEKLSGKVLFHISDEPEEHNIESYAAAKATVVDLLEGEMLGDALSLYDFYEKGYCKMPIASTHAIHNFLGKCDNLWHYYIGWDSQEGMSNRLLQVSRERNRMLGVQLYYHNIKGFLHWGYNFYYGPMSQGMFNPLLDPCGGFAGAGGSFLVYPAPDGTAYQSVRQKIFGDGLLDMRAFKLLEKLAGRDKVDEIILKHFGVPSFRKSSKTPEEHIEFINDIYHNIKNFSKEKLKNERH